MVCISIVHLIFWADYNTFVYWWPKANRGWYNHAVPNKIVIWVSVIVWVFSIVAAFATQGNDIANAVVLLVSFWLMYLGWSWNRKQRGGMWINFPKGITLGRPSCSEDADRESQIFGSLPGKDFSSDVNRSFFFINLREHYVSNFGRIYLDNFWLVEKFLLNLGSDIWSAV